MYQCNHVRKIIFIMADKDYAELTKLDGNNYQMWNFEITFLIGAKGLTSFIDGTAAEPTKAANNGKDWQEWNQKSSQVMVYLLGSVDRKLRQLLINCTKPKEVWDKLKQLYGDSSEDAKEAAWEEYYSFKMDDSKSLSLQIEQLESICRKLKEAGETLSDSAVTSKLLNSLPPRFSILRVTWDCTPAAERKKDALIAKIFKEDKRMIASEKDMTATLALHMRTLKVEEKSPNQHGAKKKFNALSKKDKKKQIEERKKKTNCGICNERGHWWRECPKRPSKDENKSQDKFESTVEAYTVGDVSVLYSSSRDEDDEIWLADSGAARHMTFRREYFTSINPLKESIPVKTADDKVLYAIATGSVQVNETVNGQLQTRELRDVLYVPGLKRNLFSVGSVTSKGFSFHAYGEKCEIRNKNGKLCSVGERRGTLYKMMFEVKVHVQCNAVDIRKMPKSDALKLWHERLGHVNVRAVIKTCDILKVHEFSCSDADLFFCEACIFGKQTRKSHKSSLNVSNYKPGEKIHSDVCGPVNIESPSGSRYFVLFKDECTSYRRVYFLRNKSEVCRKFQDFEKMIAKQTGNTLKVLRSDNGKEYTPLELCEYAKKLGIIHEFSSPYIHEQNGASERELRTLIDCARTMLLDCGINLELWPEAINTACYVLNRSVLKQGEKETAFEKWFGRKPEVKHLRVFGTDAYLHVPKEKRKKFEAKSRKVIIVGYDGESTNYRVWDKTTRKVHISSDVVFNEKSAKCSDEKKDDDVFRVEINFGEDLGMRLNDLLLQEEEEEEEGALLPAVEGEEAPPAADPEEEVPDAVGGDQGEGAANPPVNEDAEGADGNAQGRVLRDRSCLNPPDRFGIPVAYAADTVPRSYQEALVSTDSKRWKKAMDDEIQALSENKTWFLTELPRGKRAIGCKWVYSVKTDSAGNVTRYKARLVAKGFSQREGIDFFETFAPVVRYESLRILLAIAATEDYEISKFDVKTAFLYGDLKEEIYMEQPDGYTKKRKQSLVCRLLHSLYGLRQSSRSWNEKFVNFLSDFGLEPIESDKCVFVGIVEGCLVYVALYVDDGVVLCKSLKVIASVMNYLKLHFQITSGEADEFLGFRIKRDRAKRTIKISQPGYIDKLLCKFELSDSGSVSVPAEPGLHLSKGSVDNMIVPYREAVGSLLFAARVTRPDIEYAVNYASQFLESHGRVHWEAVKRILKYLSGTRDVGIVFGRAGNLRAVGFTDANYAGCVDTRKSRSGFVFMLGGAPISWSSQRQNAVSLSTAESEYIALAHGAKEALWLQRMLNDLRVKCDCMPVCVDNQSAIKMAENAEFRRSKHIDVRYHFIRDVVSRKKISLRYVQSERQLADIFTKPLANPQFSILRERMSVL